MILAMETLADVVIIDDANAKKHAKYLELPVTGTLGVLIKAKQEGYIDELKPILYQMIEKGIYISSGLVQMCLCQNHKLLILWELWRIGDVPTIPTMKTLGKENQ